MRIEYLQGKEWPLSDNRLEIESIEIIMSS